MRISKKVLSLLLALVMVLGLIPATVASATEAEEYVYLSISFDGKYIDDKNDNPIVYLPIPLEKIAAVDLAEYGLENMLFDADGDGTYEITALQLLIYAHEELYGGRWGDVNFDALPGASYFRGGIFGFTENLVYFHNGDFPVDESQESDFMTVGATSDRIVLEAGDFLDVASFSCYSFLWDQLGGFHLFADPEGNYVHDYSVAAGEALSVKLMHSFCDLMFGESWVKDATDYEVYYGATFGEAEGSVMTDDSGCAEITFDAPGTYYVWCDGDIGTDDGTHGSCEHYSEAYEPCIVSAPAYAKVTVTGEEAPEQPETPRQPQDVSAVLNATMAQLAATVTASAFGTNAGEWTVFGLARGNYFAKDNVYFADYYERIVEYVNTTAATLDMNGALDKNKSTDNSRLIVAMSAIGKDATSVGDWNLVEAYSANGINWIKRQGMNGTIWTLIALDSGNYETSDPTIRQQCVDAIVAAQHNDGGWSLVTAKTQPSNVDITGMTLTALYPYRDQPEVAAACETAFVWLSESQLDNGGFPYGQGETSESCVWAIVACTTWGINPDTDPRFIKNSNSAIDNLLTYYVEAEARFEHGRGAGSNAMATDQATYALVAYDRLINGKTALFDYSDVTFEVPETPENPKVPETPETPEIPEVPESDELKVTLTVPEKVNAGSTFNGILSVTGWKNEAGYKLIDFIVTVPAGVTVNSITVDDGLTGGQLSWHLESATGKLRVVYFDANGNSDLIVSTSEDLAALFTISFTAGNLEVGTVLDFAICEMSLKKTSDSSDEAASDVVDTEKAEDNAEIVEGLSFSAGVLYQGDGIDLIPTDKKAVAVAVTGITAGTKLTYNDGTNTIEFIYSAEISAKTGVATYVALVDASIATENFTNDSYYTLPGGNATTVTFGDTNGDGVLNAQDALAVVDAWLRKGEEPTDNEILTMNVNGDSRINTFDALGIVEKFVTGSELGVITKAATITGNQ